MDFLEYSEDSMTSGSKFKVDCKSITNYAKNTAGWLDNVTALKSIDTHKALHMSHKKILEGIFHGRTTVVIKIADTQEDLSIEWTTYSLLKEHQIPGIVRYFCYFTCDDSIARYATNINNTSTMQVLVMEYIQGKSFKHFHWPSVDVSTFRSCVKQAIFTLLEGWHSCGFIHGDFHLDNILIQKSTRTSITYAKLEKTVEVIGYQTKLMDFELSTFQSKPNANALYKNVKEFIQKMMMLLDYVNVSEIAFMNHKLRDWIDQNESNPDVIFELLPYIDRITYTGFKTKQRAGGKKCRICLRKGH